MLSHRVHRRWLSLGLILALLFAQFATAAYACPRLADSPPTPALAHMPGCPGHLANPVDEPAQAPLCKAHCDQGNQNVTAPSLPDLSASPVLLAVLDWNTARLAPSQAASRMPQATSGAPPPGAPPLYLALLVLRN